MYKVALGQVLSEYFGFPCQFLFHETLHPHLSSGAGTMGPLVADVPSGLTLNPPHEIKRNKYVITELTALKPFSQVFGRYAV
jgi:hypothetical protein